VVEGWKEDKGWGNSRPNGEEKGNKAQWNYKKTYVVEECSLQVRQYRQFCQFPVAAQAAVR
jgi:hypothetical protein